MDNNFVATPFFWIEEGKGQASTPRTRRRIKKKKEYVSWGSKQLIEFLESVGKDTAKALSQYDITNFINQYINENKLIHPEKKKRVLCDERLQALFGRKSMFRNKIHDLLESHLVENQVESEDDLFYSSDEKDEDASAVYKKQKVSSLEKKTVSKKKGEEVSKSCLAAISPENMKLVYLKRSLVQELLNKPETFESKVVGSIVRIKSDPHDIFQKNTHQLQLVTGVKAVSSGGDNRPLMHLQISGVTDDINIAALSDENFSEEECEDLQKRFKDGLLRQPTVGELEQKVAVLHEDITKHWLARELVLLRNLIDRANEKGWRHRVAEYLDKRKLLQSPAEQSRLLNEIPKVKPETIPEDPPDGINQRADDSPKAADWDWEPCYVSSTQGAMTKLEISIKQDGQAPAEIGTRSNGEAHPLSPGERYQPETDLIEPENNMHVEFLELTKREFPKTEAFRAVSNGHTESLRSDHINDLNIEAATRNESNGYLQKQSPKERDVCDMEGKERMMQVEVITLSDDEDEHETETPIGGTRVPEIHPEQLAWHYTDPKGRIQGPFSLTSLKRWSDANYFPPDFRVWRSSQSLQDAVLLSHILQQVFRN